MGSPVEPPTNDDEAATPAVCPLCASASTIRAYAEISSLERCLECGLVWLREVGEVSQYEGAFLTDSGYYSAYFARSEQWRHEAHLRLQWLLAHAQPATLLEVGSAGGFFLEATREAGIDGLGIEPSADGSKFARDELGVPVLTGSFEEVDVTGPFDAICAFHVLEHVRAPETFLARARELLPGGGWLALEVPNIDSARARRDGVRWFNLVPEYHRWHFSPPTLARLVESAGFMVESVDTAFPRHYFRFRRVATVSGLRSILADVRSKPTLRRTHPTTGDYLRLVARAR